MARIVVLKYVMVQQHNEQLWAYRNIYMWFIDANPWKELILWYLRHECQHTEEHLHESIPTIISLAYEANTSICMPHTVWSSLKWVQGANVTSIILSHPDISSENHCNIRMTEAKAVRVRYFGQTLVVFVVPSLCHQWTSSVLVCGACKIQKASVMVHLSNVEYFPSSIFYNTKKAI